VGRDVAQRVADVQPDPARIREHVEHEQSRPLRDPTRILGEESDLVRGVEDVLGVPAVLPAVLDLVGEGRRVAELRTVVTLWAHTEARLLPGSAAPTGIVIAPSGA